MTNKKIEETIIKIESIFSLMEDDYEWGGSENDEGELMPGHPSFKTALEQIINLIYKLKEK